MQALEKGIKVAGFTLGGARSELVQAGLTEIVDPAGFRGALTAPRSVFLYIPAGPAVDQTLDSLAAVLEPGDILVDGGNSYWGDSIRRQARLMADALRLEVPIPVIAQSVMQLFASRDDWRLWARAIAMMRHGFGGHPYGRNEAIRGERETGRVGGWPY